MRFGTILLLAIAGRLFGQLESNTFTISASRVLSSQPDQAIFNLSVVSTPVQGLNEVLTALETSGISAENLVSLYSLTDGTLQWLFHRPVSFAQVQTAANSLVQLQQNLAKANNGMTLDVSIDGVQTSSALTQSQVCPVTDLLSDAQAQAKRLADAAGFSVGSILTIDSSSPNVAPAPAFFSGYRTLASFLVFYFAPAPPACTITVKFRLLRYQ